MKVLDLDYVLMESVCRELRAAVLNGEVFILSNERLPNDPSVISGSKLVELRNPLPDGRLRQPLLVFVPNQLKIASEDSFGVATFEQISCAHVYGQLTQRLIEHLPSDSNTAAKEILAILKRKRWRWSDASAVIRFLLSIQSNGADEETVGASLFELGLVPDFKLLEAVGALPNRIERNMEKVMLLTTSPKSERGRIMELGLNDAEFKKKLGDFLVETGLEDPREWTKAIITDKRHWALSFDKWSFDSSGTASQNVCVEVLSLDLPIVESDPPDTRLRPLVGQQVLTIGKGALKRFSINFRVLPHPSEVGGLDHFRIEIESKQSGPIGLVKKKNVWRTKRSDATISISKLSKVDWEEGWHYVRVTAHAKNGDSIPLTDTVGNLLPWETPNSDEPRRINESAEFYVFKGDDFDIEPTQRAVPRYPTVMHALIEKKFSALTDGRNPDEVTIHKVGWLEETASPELRGNDFLEIKLGREGTCHVPTSKMLKQIEQRILSDPRGAVSWKISLSTDSSSEFLHDLSDWPRGEQVEEFLQSRCRYFENFRHNGSIFVNQACDFATLSNSAIEYAESYLRAVQHFLRQAELDQGEDRTTVLRNLRTLLSVDLIKIDHLRHRGQRAISVLIGPTHPLRSLWLATWGNLANDWIQQVKTGPKEFIPSARESLLRGLSLVSFPAVVPLEQGQLLTAVDNVHPCWTLYAPVDEVNPRGLVGEICAAFSLSEPNIGSFTFGGEFLARKFRRYLLQHPYIETLVINAFNAGRGGLLAQTLLELQREADFSHIKYNIRLFVPDPDVATVGEDLVELLTPTGKTISEEAEVFSQPTGNHLTPKLSLAFLATDNFRDASTRFPAHLSILLDAFPAQEIATKVPDPKSKAAPVYGLLQDFTIEYSEEHDTVSWTRQPRHGNARPLAECEGITTLLSRLSEVLSNAAACVATGQAGMHSIPVSKLVLNTNDRTLIHQVHEVSDWVFTVDRSMGIEFFDHAETVQRPEYLIDHSPESATATGRRLVITSRSLTEIEAMMARVLKEHSLPADTLRGSAVLRQLRVLSGRLALKLLSSVTQRSEVLGLAIAEMYLAYQGVLENQIVVPLDDHLDLYRDYENGLVALSDELNLRRTDLAIFDLNSLRRTVTCNLVEVKCYRDVGGVGAYNQLREAIEGQITQSEKVLRYNFDPLRTNPDRPDRSIKTQQLSSLLEFYASRSNRLRLLSAFAFDEALFLIRTLDDGYHLNFTRSALIFDFERSGTNEPIEENGIEYHRIGFDLIRGLLNALPTSEQVEGSLSAVLRKGASLPQEELAHHSEAISSTVPKLSKAVFIAEKRTASVSWDLLHRVSPSSSDLTRTDNRDISIESVALPSDMPASVPQVMEESTAVEEPKLGPVFEEVLERSEGMSIRLSDVIDTAQATFDVLLGATESPQYGILGQVHGQKIALDLNQTHTISLFGVQGGGKSYTLGSIIEMASMRIPGINELPNPLATVVFHYSGTQHYEPEYVSMNRPNQEPSAISALLNNYGAAPAALRDIIILTPRDKVSSRQDEYPEIPVYPLSFASSELQVSHWKFLMGAVGNQATYIRQLNQLMRAMRQHLSLDGLRNAVEECNMNDNLKGLALNRLNLASDYIDDSSELRSLIRPGRLVIVDLRDEFIEKDEALGLFVVMLQIFADAKNQGSGFNKLVVFDEAHKYIESADLVEELISVVREMRHKGTSVLIASQDPPSVPVALIELSSQIILHRFNSPAWLKHIQKANASLNNLSADQMARLSPGEAFIWSSKSSDASFSRASIRIRCRPRVTFHGGATKTAV